MTNHAKELPSRQEAWWPPERPQWVARVNRLTDDLHLGGLVPLDADSLMERPSSTQDSRTSALTIGVNPSTCS